VLRRGRFDDLVSRQLDLFAVDAAPLLDEAAEADNAWTHAGRDEAEERFGDYQLVVDELSQRMLDAREAYASSLDEHTADSYRAAFNRAAMKRFRHYAGLLADE
jgi:hypothetical protein